MLSCLSDWPIWVWFIRAQIHSHLKRSSLVSILPSHCVSTDTDAPSASLRNYPQTPGDRWNELLGNRMHLVQWHPPERLDCNVFKQWEEAMRWWRQRTAREDEAPGMMEKRTKVKWITKINEESSMWPLRAGDTPAILNTKQHTMRFGWLGVDYRLHTFSSRSKYDSWE